MGFFNKMFGSKVKEVQKQIHKSENRDLMEAVVAGAMLMAFADGELEDEELLSIDATINSLPELQHFGGEVSTMLSKYETMLKANFRVGKVKAMRELKDLQCTEDERMIAFATVLGIAEADGEIEPAELTLLKEIGSTLGVNLREFGIE